MTFCQTFNCYLWCLFCSIILVACLAQVCFVFISFDSGCFYRELFLCCACIITFSCNTYFRCSCIDVICIAYFVVSSFTEFFDTYFWSFLCSIVDVTALRKNYFFFQFCYRFRCDAICPYKTSFIVLLSHHYNFSGSCIYIILVYEFIIRLYYQPGNHYRRSLFISIIFIALAGKFSCFFISCYVFGCYLKCLLCLSGVITFSCNDHLSCSGIEIIGVAHFIICSFRQSFDTYFRCLWQSIIDATIF